MQEKLAKAETELAEHRSTADSTTRTLREELEKVGLCFAGICNMRLWQASSSHTARTYFCTHTLVRYSLQATADFDRARKQEALAKNQINKVYNPGRLSFPDWKAAQANMKQRLAQLEEAATEAGKVLWNTLPNADSFGGYCKHHMCVSHRVHRIMVQCCSR